jgi:hypothetical protein
MHTARFDMYAFIHKALRAMMADTLVAVGRVDVNDAEETAGRMAQLRSLLAACDSHLKHEEEFVHPAIEARRPGGSMKTADDHLHHRAQLRALHAAIETLEQAALPARATAARDLYLQLAEFVADNYLHMQVEERDNNAALQAAYTDEELIEIHDRLVASIDAQEMASILRWMLPSLSATERAIVVGGMAQTMPKEAFSGVLTLARQNLNGRDRFKLMTALGPMPLAA